MRTRIIAETTYKVMVGSEQEGPIFTDKAEAEAYLAFLLETR